jgi:hypothetical protein
MGHAAALGLVMGPSLFDSPPTVGQVARGDGDRSH